MMVDVFVLKSGTIASAHCPENRVTGPMSLDRFVTDFGDQFAQPIAFGLEIVAVTGKELRRSRCALF